MEISCAKDAIIDELCASHLRELETRDELNGLLRAKVNAVQDRVEKAQDSHIAELETPHLPLSQPPTGNLGLGLGDGADPSDSEEGGTKVCRADQEEADAE